MRRRMKRPARGTRHGFTLIEAMTATTLTAVCGSALLLGASTALKTTQNCVDQSIAAGLAQQLMDEISGKLWCNPGTSSTPTTLGPTGSDAGPTRQNYLNIADYNGYSATPPQDMWGVPLGMDNGTGGTRPSPLQINPGFFKNWYQQVTVYYVSSSNFETAESAGQTSNYRAVEVRIFVNEPNVGMQQLALVRRIFSYVSMP